MASTLFELGGLGWITYGVDRLAGFGWASVFAGLCLLLVGVATDDSAVRAELLRAVRVPRRAWARWMVVRAFRSRSPRSGSPHPPLRLAPEQVEEGVRLAEAARRRITSNGRAGEPEGVI